jgi:hypothetical protein
MSLVGQEGKNCLCVSSNKLFMQPSDLSFACLRIIVHCLLQRMLPLMKVELCILLGRATFFQATVKAYGLDKLFNLVFALMDTQSLHQQAYLCLLL